MPDLPREQFADLYEAVHGHEPFDWQKRLAKEVLENGAWPDVIRAPTGCGKTSVLDLAVFELARQATSEPSQRTAARRICFVIDRRLVVDEVTEHAREIRDALVGAVQGTRDEPILRTIGERLRSLAAEPSEPLRLVRLRGGVYRDDGWAADPLTPTIIVSTVDQIGSRLLFRGYGVSRRGLPVHAGLLAFDTRIILDEAHLSTVFDETLLRVREYQQWAEELPVPDCRCVSVVTMSATARGGQKAFELTDGERREERLKPRLDATKPAELIEAKVDPVTKRMGAAQAWQQEHRNRHVLAQKLIEQAQHLARLGGAGDSSGPSVPRVIGVVCNRVAMARHVFEQLRGAQRAQADRDVVLLTGRIRAYDRDRLLVEWLPRMKANREAEPDRPLFVVATQTVEVGANLDFDALVTETAPLDALRQRFGRLDRLGRRHGQEISSPATILIRSDCAKNSDADRIYGSAVAETWKWLGTASIARTEGRGRSQRVFVNFGVNELDPKLPGEIEGMRPMLAPQPEAPLLFPAHLDAWAQSDPIPEPDPEVAPFLHGQADAVADVQIVWRADLSEQDRGSWPRIVPLMPPSSREALAVPLYEARAWLRMRAEADVADVEGAGGDSGRGRQHRGRPALRWRGPDDTKLVNADNLRPGDTVVVPSTYGGTDRYGWNPSCREPVEDVADACLAQSVGSYPANAFRRPKLRLRLHRSLLPRPDEETWLGLQRLLSAAVSAAGAEEQDPWPAVGRLLQASLDHLDDPALRAGIGAILRGTRRPQIMAYPGRDGLVLVGSFDVCVPAEHAVPREEFEYDGPQSDETSMLAQGRQVSLADHTEAVEHKTELVAQACGLGGELIDALKLAARWHDEGKRDPRFQAWLHGSELRALAALAADRPLAKSGRDTRRWQAAHAFGYPRGMRHEFLSVRLLEAHRAAGGDVDLAKLLVGTHHGHGRPFVPVVHDPNPIEVALSRDGQAIAVSSDHGLHRLESGWTDLFWRLVRRYGWWGLAYLEALLVSADRSVSADEQRETHCQDEEDVA